MIDPVGSSLGVVGVVLAFKGVVDSINLIDSIVALDNGSHYLAMRYRVERRRTDVWGDEVKVIDTNSPLSNESAQTRRLITGILAELRATHDLAARYISDYDLNLAYLDNELVEGLHHIDSTRIKDILQMRKERKQKKTLLWATRDKLKFSDLVDRMKSLNDSLYDLVRTDNTQALATALSAYLIPQIQDSVNLALLQSSEVNIDPVLALSARLKQLQVAPAKDSAQEAVYLKIDDEFVLEKTAATGKRPTGYVTAEFDVPRRAWVEWKHIDRTADDQTRNEIVVRIATLQVVLAAAQSQEYRVPPCLGLLAATSPQYEYYDDIGIVYSWPQNADPSQSPETLHQLLSAEENDMPLLEDRYAIAYSLASALSLFHAAKWLHRGFRSDNILFFRDHSGELLIQAPYITGFEYSRPQSASSLEVRQTGDPALDLYYHPDVPLKGFTQLRDIYSLGVVLFELAFWKRLSFIIPETLGRALESVSLSEVQNFLLNSTSAQGLGGQVGSSYRDAVLACLSGNFGADSSGQGESFALGRAFFIKVIKKLAHCRA